MLFGKYGVGILQNYYFRCRNTFCLCCAASVNVLLLPSPPLLAFQVFSEYFKELEEESIRDNFVIIYELLDELMDFGYPQTTDSKILQE